MKFPKRSEMMSVVAGLAALLVAATVPVPANASERGEAAPVAPSWNDYPTKNVGSTGLPDGSAYLGNPNANPPGIVTPPSVDIEPPPQEPKQPKWPNYPPQQQNKPRPPGWGKTPPRPNFPPPGYRPPGVQWNKPNGQPKPPGQQGMIPPNQMDPEFFQWLNQVYQLWQAHQDQQGERQSGPAGGATPTPGGDANYLVD